MNAPVFSEQAIALEVAYRCGNDYRFVADASYWLWWNGTRWIRDQRRKLTEAITAICCENAKRAADSGDEGMGRSLASDRTNRAVLSRLSCDQRLIVTADQLDVDKHLLGTPNGFVDLTTGKEYPPERGRLITMSTSVAPAPAGSQSEAWLKFLRTTYPLVPGKDKPNEEITSFLRCFYGYGLTGEIREHTCVFLLGKGGNGKGVLMHAMQDVAGDYATVINAETLMERPVERHRSEFAVLRGKRLIFCSEVSPGKYWDYAKLMGLVGGDPIEANLMRQDPFTFYPCGKLTIGANNRPNFRVVTAAVERRLAMVRHQIRFVREDKKQQLFEEHPELKNDPKVVIADPSLEERLKSEYPAILRWMIDGAVEWYQNGLQIPASVVSETNEYLREQDDLSAWIKECCVLLTADGGGRRTDLYGSFSLWSLRRNQKPPMYKEFGAQLKDIHGFSIVHQNYGDQVVGLTLNDFAHAELRRHRDENKPQTEKNAGGENG